MPDELELERTPLENLAELGVPATAVDADELELERTPLESLAGLDVTVPTADDPGGAHAKGYSAEAGPVPPVNEDGPIPLVSGPEPLPPVRVPERDDHVRPTGRDEPGEYKTNDRLMGSDR